MATKNNPGEFDCYANALPDEPMFVLLARDTSAPWLVEIWRHLRAGNLEGARAALNGAYLILRMRGKFNVPLDSPKSKEAELCGSDMIRWKDANPNV
jgi:hypothetical protein